MNHLKPVRKTGMIRLWTISCKLNLSHKINALKFTFILSPNPSPGIRFANVVLICPKSHPSLFFCELHFPVLSSTGFKLGPTSERHQRDFGNLEGKNKIEGEVLLPFSQLEQGLQAMARSPLWF